MRRPHPVDQRLHLAIGRQQVREHRQQPVAKALHAAVAEVVQQHVGRDVAAVPQPRGRRDEGEPDAQAEPPPRPQPEAKEERPPEPPPPTVRQAHGKPERRTSKRAERVRILKHRTAIHPRVVAVFSARTLLTDHSTQMYPQTGETVNAPSPPSAITKKRTAQHTAVNFLSHNQNHHRTLLPKSGNPRNKNHQRN